MNEFVTDYRNGRLVDISRMVARFDGYYWPQVIVNTVSLAEAMRFYSERFEEISGFKSQARRSAEEHLDWSKNGAALIQILDNSRKRSKVETQKTREEVITFETQRMSFAQKHRRLFTLMLQVQNIRKSIMSGK